MKTFLILFAIAASLPADAQRVKENVRQRVEIVENTAQQPPVEEVQDERKEHPRKKDGAARKQ